jgi:hypothetical protein
MAADRILHQVHARIQAARKGRGSVSAPLPHEPQLLSFLRDPVSRCRSHWAYAQEFCRRPDRVRTPYADCH